MTGTAPIHRTAVVFAALGLGGCGGGGIDADQVFTDPQTVALAEAAAEGDSARVRELIRNGADPNARGDKGVNLLQWALLHKSTRGLAGLLAGGADPSAADSSGATVVHFAAMSNDPAYLDVLLAHRADPNVQNTVTGGTPLMSALMGNRDSQFTALLAAGADPDVADHFGNTSLHEASKINAFRHVLDLLEAGADPLARNRRGATFQRYLYVTPEKIMSEEGLRSRGAVTSWLRKHGVPPDSGRR